MKIEHIAIWVRDLERMKAFYETYFEGKSNELYHNPKKQFSSYFISFSQGCRLELMHSPAFLPILSEMDKETIGLAHFAISVGTRERVDKLTAKLKVDGYTVVGLPRTTGDGYYESVVLDPENNRIEITI